MTLIGSPTQFAEETTYPLVIKHKHLLLVHHKSHFFLMENKCGHFGVALDNAQIKNKQIICAQHGISFSLETGLVINRPYENCDPIHVYQLLQKGDSLYWVDS